MSAPDRPTVLIVDDSPGLRRTLEHALPDCTVQLASSGTEALAALSPETALVLTDVRMPGLDGLSLARELRVRRPGLPVVCMSGVVEDTLRADARSAGVLEIIRKPVCAERLRAAVPGWLRGEADAWRERAGTASSSSGTARSGAVRSGAARSAAVPRPAAAQAPEAEDREVWMARLGRLPGVVSAGLYAPGQTLTELPGLPASLGPLARAALEAALRLCVPLRLSGELRVIQLEVGDQVVLVWPDADTTLLVLVQGAPAASSVKGWLQRRVQTAPAAPSNPR